VRKSSLLSTRYARNRLGWVLISQNESCQVESNVTHYDSACAELQLQSTRLIQCDMYLRTASRTDGLAFCSSLMHSTQFGWCSHSLILTKCGHCMLPVLHQRRGIHSRELQENQYSITLFQLVNVSDNKAKTKVPPKRS